MTQPNPSPGSSTRQDERNASRTRSRSGRMTDGLARITSKDDSFCEEWHPPECLLNTS